MKPLLILLSTLYSFIVKLRLKLYRLGVFKIHSTDKYLISVGNISMGGTGKSPMTSLLANYYSRSNLSVAVLTRGYGSKSKIEPYIFCSEQTDIDLNLSGDEPKMMALQTNNTDFYVFPDRALTLKLAEKNHDVIILDDGLQRLNIRPDLNLVLLDSEKGLADDKVFPAGELRLTKDYLSLADCIVITKTNQFNSNKRQENLENEIRNYNSDCPIFYAKYKVDELKTLSGESVNLDKLKNSRVFLLTAIASPVNFENTVESLGMVISDKKYYPDHHQFSEAEILEILDSAERQNIPYVVMTEKDAVKFPEILRKDNLLMYIGVSHEIESVFFDFLNNFKFPNNSHG